MERYSRIQVIPVYDFMIIFLIILLLHIFTVFLGKVP